MIVAAKIRLKVQSCEECHTMFEEGSVIHRSDADGKDYCRNCFTRKNPNASFNKGNVPYTRYIAEGKPGESMTGRLVLDHSIIIHMEDGIYGMKDSGGCMAVNAMKDSYMPLEKFLTKACGNEFALIKKDGHSMIIFSQRRFLDVDAFVDHKDIFEYIRDYLGILISEKPLFVCNEEHMVVGVADTRECELVRSFLPVGYIISEILSMEDLEVKYEGKISGKYTGKAIEALSPQAMLSYCEKQIRGQGIQLKLAVYQIYRYMQSVKKGDLFCADNWILTAPSGSGKTEFYKTIRQLFTAYKIPIPVVQIDLSQITEAGYKGSNVSTIPQRILAEKPDCKGIAICFLDEADKKCVPSYSNNVDNNAAVQANLLTLIEGTELKVEVGDEKKDYNSNYTMFVLMGAFQSIRQQKQKKRAAKPLGFTANCDVMGNKDDIDLVEDCFYEDLTLQDMIDYGMREELAGRMVQVVNFHKLSEEDMLELIRYKVKEISKSMGIEIWMTED
ncbi:MAG: AAA family ATPase, partial [Acetatifactor sp.]|nr:AAA family ATPase [Acetatifactor sp.]